MKNCGVKSEIQLGQQLKTKIIMIKKHMKIKFNSDDDLPLTITLEIRSMSVVARTDFHEDSKYYPQVFLDECLYK